MHLFLRSFSTATAALLLTLVGLKPISADVVIPNSIKAFHQGDSLTGNGAALQVINGSGMSKPDPNDPSTWTVNSTAWADDWQGFSTPSGNNTTWTVLDLGSPTPNLDQIYLWNVQENNARDRGTNRFNIFHATSPTGTPPRLAALSPPTILQAADGPKSTGPFHSPKALEMAIAGNHLTFQQRVGPATSAFSLSATTVEFAWDSARLLLPLESQSELPISATPKLMQSLLPLPG
ncbi:hypothetical protein OAF07_00640 [bacterium]|nr:hypothetical protein [bacterium]